MRYSNSTAPRASGEPDLSSRKKEDKAATEKRLNTSPVILHMKQKYQDELLDTRTMPATMRIISTKIISLKHKFPVNESRASKING